MTSLVTFSFVSQSVRVNIVDDAPWFCLSDVASILELQNAAQDRFALDQAGISKAYVSYPSGKKLATFINEPNLYRVIFRSNKPEARKFQDWVFDTVLPTIRATGGFSTSGFLTRAQRRVITDKVAAAAELVNYQEAAKHAIYARLRKETGVKAVHHLTQGQYDLALDTIAKCRTSLQQFNQFVEVGERRYVRGLAYGQPQLT